MPRQPRDYRTYPAAYAQWVDEFAATGARRWGPMPAREATRLRHDLEAWLQTLRRAADAGDGYALDLCGIIVRGVWSMPAVAPPDGPTGHVWLRLDAAPPWSTPSSGSNHI